MKNALTSEQFALVGRVDPDATAASTVTSGWIAVKDFEQFIAHVCTGTLGTSATVDAKLEQATDSGGTGAKDISGKAITQLVKASNDDDDALINLRAEEMDVDNGFDYFRLSITVGTATSDISGAVWGAGPRFGPASDNDLASVVEIVS